MTVVVTGASGFIGPAVVSAFARRFPQVRAYVRRREAAEPLRALGAKVAVGDIDDLDTLEVVMRGAFTVCHLAGGVNLPDERAYEETNLESVRSALEAATRAGVKRFLFLSYPGASPDASNPFLRCKGLAEEAVRGSGLQHAIVRSAHVYGMGGIWFACVVEGARRRPPLVVGPGDQVVAPVFVEDLADVLAAADDRRGSVSGTWAIEGPDRLSADALVDLLVGQRVDKEHLGPDRIGELVRLLERRVSLAALQVLASDSLADAPDAASEFGVTQSAFGAGLELTLERVPGARLERLGRSEREGSERG